MYWECAKWFYEKFKHVLNLRKDLLVERAEMYAAALNGASSPLDNFIGFKDCTKIRMARPGGNNFFQRSCYSGHKRMHCLVYQTITAPNGLIFASHGPEVGRRHDLTLLRSNGWENMLENDLNVNVDQYYIFGDIAYLLCPSMITPFVHGLVAVAERIFNRLMSSLRVFVEDSYQQLKQCCISNDFAINIKVRKAPIAMAYKSSAILTNSIACLYKSGANSKHFGV